MKKIVLATTLFLISGLLSGQKINGQWRGYFDSNGDIVLSGGENTEYVLEIEVNGSQVSGYSYSYFQNRRFYVICSLTGTYYKSTKSMKVTETARIKGLTPPDWNDCLQTHILTYQKNGDTEELTGRWVTAPGQVSNCGKGNTTLTRRTVRKDLSSYNKPKSNTPFSTPKNTAKQLDFSDKNRKSTKPPAVKTIPKTKPAKGIPPVVKKSNTAKPKTSTYSTPIVKAPVKVKPKLVTTDSAAMKNKSLQREIPEVIAAETNKKIIPVLPPSGRNFEKRSNDILKTIQIDHPTFKVDLYDNGDIDGDSISLFYNGKLLLSRKRLTDKPITLTLDVTNGKEVNELTMYAENLGTIPPNTALMIVTDGDNRYEVRIASDLKKSGTIRFVKKDNIQAP